ncbi:MAG: exodeoxyribonuclease III [Coriobacteriales bacterium]|jgi:exodeoxyribonuclease-3|nr:exodeoxyribonuclease III [Coriobacteriales bacterium]
MRCISWNVNGLRAVINKGLFYTAFEAFDADVFALQEIKLQAGQVDLELPEGYHQTWSYAEKKGYAGTAVFSRETPLQTIHTLGLKPGDTGGTGDHGLPDPSILDTEGRLCAVEFERYWFICCYTPNSQDELRRLDLRLAWGRAFTRFAKRLAKRKPVVICGDLNVAHTEIDLKNPKTNHFNAGFTDEERADFSALLKAGFTDSFRHLHPETTGAYSWWSFRGRARENNAGWRIDYFVVSNDLAPLISEASIYPEVTGSDHCPIGLEIEL